MCHRCWNTGVYYRPLPPDGALLQQVACDHPRGTPDATEDQT
jgi:hypothetical protein